ncbi:MAG: helix-turn-helix transcriptional regulator [Nakamurella sp.]
MQDTSDSLNKHIGANTAERRAQMGWSQAELAERLGAALGRKLDPTAVTRIEGGVRTVSAVELVALADLFGVPMSWLVEDPAPARRMVRRWDRISKEAEVDAYRAERERTMLHARVKQIAPVLRAWSTLADSTASADRDVDAIRHALVVIYDLGTFAPDGLEEEAYSPNGQPTIDGNLLRSVLEQFVDPTVIDDAWTTALDWDGPQHEQLGDEQFTRADEPPARVFLGQILANWRDRDANPEA